MSRCTGFEGLFERIRIDGAKVRFKGLRVLDVDRETRRDERMKGIKCYKSDGHDTGDNSSNAPGGLGGPVGAESYTVNW